MEISFKPLISFLILFIISIISYKIAYFIAEEYFFDQLIYQKSLAHGYFPPGYWNKFEKYGERADDIEKYIMSPNSCPLQKERSNKYTIAIISDSYGWGAGLRNKFRFTKLLETQLSNLYPTDVLSISLSGDSILDHYLKYNLLYQQREIDLYIFDLKPNDLIFTQPQQYDSYNYKNISKKCSDTPAYVPDYKNPQSFEYDMMQAYSPKNSNICISQIVLDMLPTNKSIYFTAGEIIYGKGDTYQQFYTTLIRPLQQKGIKVITNLDTNNIINNQNKFISNTEKHPSKLLNKVFANFLYQEIISNPKYNFPLN